MFLLTILVIETGHVKKKTLDSGYLNIIVHGIPKFLFHVSKKLMLNSTTGFNPEVSRLLYESQ